MLKCVVDSPTYAASYFDPRGTTELHFPIPAAPYVKAAAVHGDDDTLTFFLLNRNLEEDAGIDIAMKGFRDLKVKRATTLRHADLAATNTKENPDAVRPEKLPELSVNSGSFRAKLPPASWNVIRLQSA